MRKVEAKWRRAYKSPVARQLNQRFNCLARARSFWALRLKAEGSQICDLRVQPSRSEGGCDLAFFALKRWTGANFQCLAYSR